MAVLDWDLTWGQREDVLLAAAEQSGETPKVLQNKPVLHPWLVWVYEAFWLLDAGRPLYQGSVGRIALSEMKAYVDLFRLEETEAKQLFIMMIRALDSVYVKLINAEISRKLEQQRKAEEEARLNGRRK